MSQDERDIAPLPVVVNPIRRIQCAYNLARFLKTYYPKKFRKSYSENHKRYIKRLQNLIINDGCQSIGMPRGQGKTEIAKGSIVWATAYGHRRAAVIVAATVKKAISFLDDLKIMYRGSIFSEDFPEISYPLKKLGTTTRLAAGQTFYGAPTGITIKQTMMKLPSIPMSDAAGATIWAMGITGAIRGESGGTLDEVALRPDYVIIDDPQKDEDAINPERVAKIEKKIKKTILGLAGDGEGLACVMPCTVIQRDDVADRFLDRKKYPQWRGLRYKMVEKFPERMDLWEFDYARLRREVSAKAATEYYRNNREEMDKGAIIDWPQSYSRKHELSRLQHAMNKLIDDPDSFYSERQNEPLEDKYDDVIVSAHKICERINGLDQCLVPDRATKITAGVDIHKGVIYWLVAAWDKDLTGWVIDYGTFPKQSTQYFGNRDDGLFRVSDAYPYAGIDEAIRFAIVEVLKELIDRDFDKQNGDKVRVDQILVDSGYKPQVIEEAIYTLTPAEGRVVTPSLGRSIRATSKPMALYKPEIGLTIGYHWLYEKPGKRTMKHYVTDTNYWKLSVHESFATPITNPGALTLWGHEPERHRLLADHCAAEGAELVKACGREIYEFFTQLNKPDNHYFDCLVYAKTAASTLGLGPI